MKIEKDEIEGTVVQLSQDELMRVLEAYLRLLPKTKKLKSYAVEMEPVDPFLGPSLLYRMNDTK